MRRFDNGGEENAREEGYDDADGEENGGHCVAGSRAIVDDSGFSAHGEGKNLRARGIVTHKMETRIDGLWTVGRYLTLKVVEAWA